MFYWSYEKLMWFVRGIVMAFKKKKSFSFYIFNNNIGTPIGIGKLEFSYRDVCYVYMVSILRVGIINERRLQFTSYRSNPTYGQNVGFNSPSKVKSLRTQTSYIYLYVFIAQCRLPPPATYPDNYTASDTVPTLFQRPIQVDQFM